MKLETLQSLKERRSIRAYQKEQIKEDELQAVLEAGMYAPTSMGKQSPKMVVVQDPETVHVLSEMNREIMGVEFDPFYGAPTIVIVFAESEETPDPHRQPIFLADEKV
jgi:nitroreductase